MRQKKYTTSVGLAISSTRRNPNTVSNDCKTQWRIVSSCRLRDSSRCVSPLRGLTSFNWVTIGPAGIQLKYTRITWNCASQIIVKLSEWAYSTLPYRHAKSNLAFSKSVVILCVSRHIHRCKSKAIIIPSNAGTRNSTFKCAVSQSPENVRTNMMMSFPVSIHHDYNTKFRQRCIQQAHSSDIGMW